MNTSTIEWTEKTWNPVTGCTPVSAGCEHCYARRMANRLRGRHGYPADDPFRVTLHPDRLDEPLHLCKPRRIFVVSMGDLLHKDVPFDFINRVFGTMCLCPQHIFQVLTKRAERLPRLMSKVQVPWPLPNVWLGVTVENADHLDRIDYLLQTPAAVRFVSLEPLLAEVDVEPYLGHGFSGPRWIDWVIVGGETGPGARPMHPDWVRGVRDQCAAAGVPFFFKHWGEWAIVPADPKMRKTYGFPRCNLMPDGSDWPSRGFSDPENPPNMAVMARVGRKAAGRHLDGRTHDAMPETAKEKPR